MSEHDNDGKDSGAAVVVDAIKALEKAAAEGDVNAQKTIQIVMNAATSTSQGSGSASGQGTSGGRG